MASCREFIERIKKEDTITRVNCGSCVKWDRETERCKDEAGVVERYEETPEFDKFDREMKANKGVYLG